MNSSIILQAIGFGSPSSSIKGTQAVYVNLKNICVGNLILSAAGLIPGYYATFFLIDSWGRKPIQLYGFIILTVLFVIMGFGYDKLTSAPGSGSGSGSESGSGSVSGSISGSGSSSVSVKFLS